MSKTWTGEQPAPAPPAALPRMIATSVVRATNQGESHGGVYLVDLLGDGFEQVIDWNEASISWEGRGADRGLRGIAFHEDRVLLAASDEIFVYDREFCLIGSHRNRYLKHCHEIAVDGDQLYMTSTGFDSILVLDLGSGRFREGHCLRFGRRHRLAKQAGHRPVPSYRQFDPEAAGGPEPADTTHLNSVVVSDGTTYACGTKVGHLLAVRDGRIASHAVTPYHTHTARPFDGGALLNQTGSDRICIIERDGTLRESHAVPRYPSELLTNVLGEERARQGFGRGLTTLDGGALIVGGSSPATVSLYARSTDEPIASVNLTMDVRNAIHGLEAWPF
jgi:hypothetical protein